MTVVRHALASWLLVAAMPACVPSNRSVFRPVDAELDRRLALDVSWRTTSADPRVPAAVASLLTKPLDRDAAIRIALAQNRRLQSQLDGLGVAAGAIATATLLGPTEIDASYKFALSGSGSEIEFDAVQDVLELLQVGQRRGIAQAGLAAAQARAVATTIELVADVEVGFYDLVAAQQMLELRQTAFDAASASAEVTERMHGAGNTTDLALARERDLRESTRVEVASAQLEVEVRRERLNALMGLSGDDTRWKVAGRLPDLPEGPPSLDDLERDAITQSLDLAALRAEAGAASGRVGLARVRTWLPALGVGVAVSRRGDEGWEAGPAVRIGLPIFGQQQGERASAHARLRQAQHQLTATAVELRAVARATRQRALEAHAAARHLRDVILPLRQQVLVETLRQYNAMNASTFELLEARRDIVDAGRDYIAALRRFWRASASVSALRRGAMPTSDGDGDEAETGASDRDDADGEH